MNGVKVGIKRRIDKLHTVNANFTRVCRETLTNQRLIKDINQLARGLKARGLNCVGIETDLWRSTTLSLYRQKLYQTSDLKKILNLLSAVNRLETIPQGELEDIISVSEHFHQTSSELGKKLPERTLIENTLKHFVEVPLHKKLVERNSRVLEVLNCASEKDIANMTVNILKEFFDGSNPTFMIVKQGENGQLFLIPFEIAMPEGFKKVGQTILGKKLGEHKIPVSPQKDNFYVKTLINGKVFLKHEISEEELRKRACDFLDEDISNFLRLRNLVHFPSGNRSYLMVPLIARGKKFGVVTFLKNGRLLVAEQEEIENFLKLVAYTISFMRAEKDLEELVKERTTEIQRMERQITRMGLAAGMAHIGRNKLNVILGHLALSLRHAKKTRDQLTELLRDLINKEDVDMEKVVRTIIATHEQSVSSIRKTYEAAQSYLKIIDQFLEYARPAKLDLKMMNPKEAIEKIMEDIPITSGIRVLKEFEENLPEIAVDLSFFGPVVEEIIRNAMDEFEKIEGEKIIKLSLNATGQGIRFVIWNSGTRLPNGEAGKIFDPFMSTKVGKGKGLGLATAAKIIDDHGWNIRANEEGKGVAFIIEVPIKK